MYSTILFAIKAVVRVLELAILDRAFLSWMPIQSENRLINLLYQITEPFLAPIRSLIDKYSNGRTMTFDFSPIIALLLIDMITNIIFSLLR
jgi:YggT family protein